MPQVEENQMEASKNDYTSDVGNTNKFQLGKRLSYSGYLCTIKYIGQLPQWSKDSARDPEFFAIGVEWDNPTRGKNNGTLNGISYFKTTDNLNSGSFIKSTKKDDGYRTFIDALEYKYGNGDSINQMLNAQHLEHEQPSSSSLNEISDFNSKDSNNEIIKFGNKIVESYGFQKFSKYQSNFKNLEIISLDFKLINNNTSLNFQKLNKILPNLSELHLNHNLFNDFKIIVILLKNLPNLNKLSLNGNKFNVNSSITNNNNNLKFNNLKILNLNSCFNSNNDIVFLNSNILVHFPNLIELNLSSNNFSNLNDLNNFNYNSNLLILDLSFNKFENLKNLSVWKCNIKSLNISNNSIQLNYSDPRINSINKIDLSNNQITSWNEITHISEVFPNLNNLKIEPNPLMNSESTDSILIQLIGRLSSKIEYLNGSLINPTERKTFELYFISKLNAIENFEISSQNKRLLEICENNGLNINNIIDKLKNPNICDNNNNNNINPNDFINIIIKFNSVEFMIKVFENYKIGKLRGKISSRLKLSILDFKLYSILNDKIEYLNNDQDLIRLWNLKNNDILVIIKDY
ncbi:hypothetical protein B5S27_g5722 [[Candida] boidinii]|nr:hypothetical protein B5S27_g5722 [[Candida] boidinii]